jgi:hypothetical protein
MDERGAVRRCGTISPCAASPGAASVPGPISFRIRHGRVRDSSGKRIFRNAGESLSVRRGEDVREEEQEVHGWMSTFVRDAAKVSMPTRSEPM